MYRDVKMAVITNMIYIPLFPTWEFRGGQRVVTAWVGAFLPLLILPLLLFK